MNEIACRYGADLIVVGSHGQSLWREGVLLACGQGDEAHLLPTGLLDLPALSLMVRLLAASVQKEPIP